MKKTVLLLVIAMMMNVTFVSAKILNPRKNYVNASQELTELLSPSIAIGQLENDVQVKVRVLVTETGELVVLQTLTDNEELSNYIKDALNYKKLSSGELVPGKDYVFEVKFKA
ncbi:hypothetical protein [Flavobacterium sp. UMI-01]|uniref:hypothetical protein n=1 Tax=Flavobacterium sp. UMI-01 TaxID=1441053 RepID=UPI001C7D37F0|nr:hypothetical protein [Flavobacterium sp. UMI-01]GIZ10123.1 hypothetical protein FUMI01_28490 [Flavobacterium sp. UMI-01]